MDVTYTDEEVQDIEAKVDEILTRKGSKGMSKREARVREVIERYRGDAGLSAHGVDYLASCIMYALSTAPPHEPR